MSEAAAAAGSLRGSAQRRAIFGWVMFDWASQPFFTLITIFVFSPYFVGHFLGDSVLGQSMWGYTVALAGFVVAVTSPVLGAISDAGGRRNPWIYTASVIFVLGCCGLWLAAPGAPYGLAVVMAAFVLASVGAEVATVFTNAMMPDIVARDRIGWLSGFGWAMGYVGGLVALLVMLATMIAVPETGLTLIGLSPVLGLDPAQFEGDRFSGPFSALWYIVFVIPLFLYVPDRPAKAPAGKAVREGLAQLRATLARLLSRRGPLARFLVARMIYQDGLAAIFAFGGAYGAAIFGWRATEVGVFGIILILAATAGSWIGGYLDDLMGSRRLIMWCIVLLAAATLAAISVDPSHILFVIETDRAVPGALFASTPELVYLLFGSIIGFLGGPIQASSRTLLVHLAPGKELAEHFGLYTLVGKATAFLAPLLIGLVTASSGSLRLGMSVIIVFFIAGGLVLMGVPDSRTKSARA